ncbi:MAG: dockerin type I domain-containing protein [Candidatus Bathyarchaeia archaeon]
MKTQIFPLFLFALILTLLVSTSYSQQYLEITIETNRNAYYRGEIVQVYGNLTLDGEPVTDGLVAVEVNDARGSPLIIRTLNTGTQPQMAWYVYIGTIFTSDQQGNPRSDFYRGELLYVNITVVNNDVEPRHTLVTATALDKDLVPMGTASVEATIPGRTYTRYIVSIPVPTDAAIGTATIYVNAYTEWPMLQGVPYCPERNTTCNIVSTSGSASATTTTTQTIQQASQGYNLTFKIPRQIPVGIFTAYVSSIYQGLTAFNSKTFQVKMLGDVNGDGRVDYWDLYYLGKSYGKQQDDPQYNPEADFNRDGKINFLDLYIIGINYGKRAL